MIIEHYNNFFPLNRERTINIIKTTKRIFAILAAPAAIPPKPKIPAITAKMIKVMVQRNIVYGFKVNNSYRSFKLFLR